MSDKIGKYSNAFQCAALILKDEGKLSFLISRVRPEADLERTFPGPRAFYKGFTMCFLRLWPHSIVSLLVFEQLRRNLGLAPI